MTEKEKLRQRMEKKRVETLVEEIHADFETRRAARRMLERGWELNMNFVSGRIPAVFFLKNGTKIIGI